MTETNSATPLRIDIVSDVMCPWCYIGQKNLEAAIALAKDVPVEVHWRPYQLDPTLPPEGRDRTEYLNNKFGGPQRAKEIYARVAEAGTASGINFQFEKMAVSPNTLDAHRVIKWAGGVSREVQNRLVERLFELFFIEGANVGDHTVLTKAAKEAGLDEKIVADLLPRDDDKEAVQQEIAQAQAMGVTGVPYFIFDGKYGVAGAQPPQVLAQALQQIAAEKEKAASQN